MALSPTEKRWLRKMIREEFREIITEMIAEEKTQQGGYDGATPVVDDDWADEGIRRIGFAIPNTGVTPKHTL